MDPEIKQRLVPFDRSGFQVERNQGIRDVGQQKHLAIDDAGMRLLAVFAVGKRGVNAVSRRDRLVPLKRARCCIPTF